MSTFSSVVRKPGQKITPRATPRRNVQRYTGGSRVLNGILSTNDSSEDHATRDGRTSEDADVERPRITTSKDYEANNNVVGESVARVRKRQDLALQLSEDRRVLDDDHHDESVQISRNLSPLSSRRSSQRAVNSISQTNGVPTVAVVNRSIQSPVSTTKKAVQARRDSTSSNLQGGHGVLGVDSSDNGRENLKRKRTTIEGSIRIQSPNEFRGSPAAERGISTSQRGSSIDRYADLEPANELLQQATTQAAAVSSLARKINQKVGLQWSGQTQAGLENYVNSKAGANSNSTIQRRRQLRQKDAEGGSESKQADSKTGRRKRRRQATPENAEENEIDTSEVQMADLTKDNKLGKSSELGQRLRENWPEVLRRRQDQMALNREQVNGSGKHGRRIDKPKDNSDGRVDGQLTTEIPMPQMTVVNGIITVTTESREVAFGTGLEQAVVQDAEIALEDDKIFRYVNQGTLSRHAGVTSGPKWDDDNTELFYKGLRMFGTDFMMIANLFPGITRKQIKLKYTKEERLNLARIRESLGTRQQIGLEEYAQMTNKDFEDPRQIQAEMEAEEKRLRAEDEKRRAQEGFVHEVAEAALQSTEEGPDGLVNTIEEAQVAAIEAIDRVHSEAVRDNRISVPNKKKTRKPKESVKSRQSKRIRRPMEGVEEVIGPIDEVG